MAAAQRKQQWSDIVALMRMDVRDLGRTEGQADRFLQRFIGAMDALGAQTRREWGLNAHEMQAITALWEFGRMTMTELGQRIPLSRAAVTTLTDRLERLGYVRRVPDPTDRRRILLDITELVEERYQEIQHDWVERVNAYVQDLDPKVWASVVDVLADLRDLARTEADTMRGRVDTYVKPKTRGAKLDRRDDASDSDNWW